jgi:hypothetical protein
LNTDIVDLLRNAAGIFAELANAYEEDRHITNSRLDYIESQTAKNREALKAAAEMILSTLN